MIFLLNRVYWAYINMDIAQIKEKALPVLKESGVTRSSLFGSMARGEGNKDSDIDMLIEFSGRKSLFDLADLQIKLEKILGSKVDVLTYRSLSPYLKETIQKEALQIL